MNGASDAHDHPHGDNDAMLEKTIEFLTAHGFPCTRSGRNRLRVRHLNYYPADGTITIDGIMNDGVTGELEATCEGLHNLMTLLATFEDIPLSPKPRRHLTQKSGGPAQGAQVIPQTFDDALDDDLVTVFDRNDEAGCYAIKVGRLNTMIFIELGRLTNSDRTKFTVTHAIKTPCQAAPYITTLPIAPDPPSALYRAVHGLTDLYRMAVSDGHKPEESWLVCQVCYLTHPSPDDGQETADA
jgi:hypothetical protein